MKCEKNNQQHLDSKEEEDFAMNRSSFVNEDVTTSNFQRQGHEIFRLFGGREISCMYISIAAMTWRFFLLFPICLNFFMLHSIPLLLPTYYIILLIFQKSYRSILGSSL